MIAELLGRLLLPKPLAGVDARRTFDALLASDAGDAGRAAILVALAARAETAGELAALAAEMRRRARPFPVPPSDRPIDLCGSGGAPRRSFNVSTVSAFVVAADGVPVVKHGNRSARSPSGSSDLLEALGLPVVDAPGFARATYRRHRLAFLHAPLFHPATRAVAPARRLIGIPTPFNRLGPLTNPAPVAYQVAGAPDLASAERTAAVLKLRGVRRGISMTSAEGCDEFSPRAPTRIVTWDGGSTRRGTVRPERLLAPEDRRGSWGALPAPSAAEEAERILAGGGGARRGSVVLTSGAALWVAGRTPTLAAGVERAGELLDDGRAEKLLADLRLLAPRYATHREG